MDQGLFRAQSQKIWAYLAIFRATEPKCLGSQAVESAIKLRRLRPGRQANPRTSELTARLSARSDVVSKAIRAAEASIPPAHRSTRQTALFAHHGAPETCET